MRQVPPAGAVWNRKAAERHSMQEMSPVESSTRSSSQTPCFCRYASNLRCASVSVGVPAKVPSLSARVFVRRRNYHADWERKKKSGMRRLAYVTRTIYALARWLHMCLCTYSMHACTHCGPDWMSCCACSCICMVRSVETRN